MAKIFISYRRGDSQYQADKLHSALKPYVANPKSDIFIDVDNIPFGVDFEAHLDGKVAQCEVLLALIGDGWSAARDPMTGLRRLDDPQDFVRIEIAAALKRGIPVVPVLLDGAPIPAAAELPDDLKGLARRNGLPVSRSSFDADIARLVNGLPISLPGKRNLGSALSSDARNVPLGLILGGFAILAAAVMVAGVALFVRPDLPARSPAGEVTEIAGTIPSLETKVDDSVDTDVDADQVASPMPSGTEIAGAPISAASSTSSELIVAAEPGSPEDFAHWHGDGRVYFSADSSGLDSKNQYILNEYAGWLHRFRNVRILVAGHSADEGLGGGVSQEYAFALGQRRADAVKDYLVSIGISASRIDTVSFGGERKLDQGISAEANARNRHAQVIPLP